MIEPSSVPSSLELLRVPFAFTQTTLLDESQFRSEAKIRGVVLDRRQLELLHRQRLLVPMFELHDRNVGDPMDVVPPGRTFSTWSTEVFARARIGRLSDHGARRYRPWPSDAERVGLLYSGFQLLALFSLEPTVRAMRGSRNADDGVAWDLAMPHKTLVDHAARARTVAKVLEVLAPRYLPRVLRRVTNPDDDLIAHIDGLDRPVEDALIAQEPAVIVKQAEALLRTAFDPLGKWHRIVRISDPSRWKDLRFDALLAHEHRIAAELLLRYYEDLASVGRAPELAPPSETWHEARHDRLTVSRRERAETILDFGLSDRPALVLAVEGETEFQIVPKVLSSRGIDEFGDLIQLINLKGVDGDVRLLARAVAVPRLDPRGYRGARLLSPLTALVVAVDQEKGYRTEQQRAHKREGMIDEVLGSLPTELRTESMRKDLRELLHVRTWGTHSFEFAHFTDREIAAAIRRVCRAGLPDAATLRARVAACRAEGRDVGAVWSGWVRTPGKPALAAELWPALQHRLLRSASSRRSIPVKEVVDDAIRLALHVRRVRELALRNSESGDVSAPRR